jgi:hypothetical protein
VEPQHPIEFPMQAVLYLIAIMHSLRQDKAIVYQQDLKFVTMV